MAHYIYPICWWTAPHLAVAVERVVSELVVQVLELPAELQELVYAQGVDLPRTHHPLMEVSRRSSTRMWRCCVRRRHACRALPLKARSIVPKP